MFYDLELNKRYSFRTRSNNSIRRGTLINIFNHTSSESTVNQTLIFICVDNSERQTKLSVTNDQVIEICDLTEVLNTVFKSLSDNPISIINSFI